MSIRRIRRLIPRKSAARSGSWAMMRCAPRRSLSLLFYVYDIYIVVQEKINKRDWFCSLCVGQENYCMYIYYIKNIRVCMRVQMTPIVAAAHLALSHSRISVYISLCAGIKKGDFFARCIQLKSLRSLLLL
jgi:hypothetical protein